MWEVQIVEVQEAQQLIQADRLLLQITTEAQVLLIIDQPLQVIIRDLPILLITGVRHQVEIIHRHIVLRAELIQALVTALQAEVPEEVQAVLQEAALGDQDQEGGINSPFFLPTLVIQIHPFLR
jgi:hypothetical protein